MSDKDQQTLELGLEAKGFLESKLFKATQGFLSHKLEEEYPTPNKRGWEDKYRYARAMEQVSVELLNHWLNLKSEHERLTKLEANDGEPNVEDGYNS